MKNWHTVDFASTAPTIPPRYASVESLTFFAAMEVQRII